MMSERIEDMVVETRDCAFTLNSKKWLEKRKEFLLSDPHDYIKELLRFAVQSGATKIDIDTKPGSTEILFDGRGYGLEDMKRFSSIMGDGREAGSGYSEFATAFISSLSLGLRDMEFESETEGGRIRMVLDKSLKRRYYSLEADEVDGSGLNRISLRWSPGIFERISGRSKRAAAETDKIIRSCRYARIDVTLNDEEVKTELTLDDMLMQMRFDYDGVSGVIGIPWSHRHESDITYLKDGIDIRRNILSVDTTDDEYTIAVNNDDLRLVLSRNDMVDDEEHVRIQDALGRARLDLHARAAENLEELRAGSSRELEVFSIPPGRNTILTYFDMLDRIKLYIRSGEAKLDLSDTDRDSSNYTLCSAKLFETVDNQRVSLHDLEKDLKRFGFLSYTPHKEMRGMPFHGRRVLVYDDAEYDFLRDMFGKLKDYSAPLEKEIVVNANISQLVREADVQHLELKHCICRKKIDSPEMAGEIGLATHAGGGQGSTIMFVKDRKPVRLKRYLDADFGRFEIKTIVDCDNLNLRGRFHRLKEDGAYGDIVRMVLAEKEKLLSDLIDEYERNISMNHDNFRDLDPDNEHNFHELDMMARHLVAAIHDYVLDEMYCENKDIPERLRKVRAFRTTSGELVSLDRIAEEQEEHENVLFVHEYVDQVPFSGRMVVHVPSEIENDMLFRMFQMYWSDDALESQRRVAEQIEKKPPKRPKLRKRSKLASVRIDEDGIEGEIAILKLKEDERRLQLCIKDIPVHKEEKDDVTGRLISGVLNCDRLTHDSSFSSILPDRNLERLKEVVQKHTRELYEGLFDRLPRLRFSSKRYAERRLQDFMAYAFKDFKASGKPIDEIYPAGSLEHDLLYHDLFPTLNHKEVSLMDLCYDHKKNGSVAFVAPYANGTPFEEKYLVACHNDSSVMKNLRLIFGDDLVSYTRMLGDEQDAKRKLRSRRHYEPGMLKHWDVLMKEEIRAGGIEGVIGIGSYPHGRSELMLLNDGLHIETIQAWPLGVPVYGMVDCRDFATNTSLDAVMRDEKYAEVMSYVEGSVESLCLKLADAKPGLDSHGKKAAGEILLKHVAYREQGKRKAEEEKRKAEEKRQKQEEKRQKAEEERLRIETAEKIKEIRTMDRDNFMKGLYKAMEQINKGSDNDRK